LANNLPINSVDLVNAILNTSGRVIFSGMGKSGLVAKKLVATFSSTGTPALYLDPAQAMHGDLGMLKPEDLFIALSKSGSGLELEQILSILKNNENYTVLISCAKGPLSGLVNLDICLPFTKEACHLNLAPTTSSTLTMAFGDAVSVAVSKLKNFGKSDFARAHPAGALGKRLLLKVKNLIINQDLPLLNLENSFQDILYLISSKKLGLGLVVDYNKKLLGIITDGDLRRSVQAGPTVFNLSAKDIMTKNPKIINQNILAYDALKIMENFKITSLVTVDDNNLVTGVIHIHDILKQGISRE
jgi:arabinose-5-phosphate isomerase